MLATSVNLLIVAGFGCFDTQAVFAQGKKDGAGVLSRYKKALSDLEAKYASVKVMATMTVDMHLATKEPSLNKSVIALQRNGQDLMKCTHYLGTEEVNKSGVEESVLCGNGDLMFAIQRKVNSKDYVAVNISKGRKANPKSGQGPMMNFRFVDYLYKYAGVPIKDLLDDPGFELKSVEDVVFEGTKMLQIQFELTAPSKINTIRSGTIVVSPAEGWLLHRYEVKLTGPLAGTTNVLAIEYTPQADGTFLPKRLVDMRGHSAIYTIDFDSVKFEATPPQEFTLDYYGLTEPDPVKEQVKNNVSDQRCHEP